MPACPNCGKIVGDLRKHEKRGRCQKQRRHADYVEKMVKKFERRAMT